jgi:hypothetical protein
MLFLQDNPLPETNTTASSPIFTAGYRPARAASFAEDQSIQVSSSQLPSAALPSDCGVMMHSQQKQPSILSSSKQKQPSPPCLLGCNTTMHMHT